MGCNSQGPRFFFQNRRDQTCLAHCLERPFSRRHFIQHGAEGKNVAARHYRSWKASFTLQSSVKQGGGVALEDTCGLFWRAGVAYSLSRVLP